MNHVKMSTRLVTSLAVLLLLGGVGLAATITVPTDYASVHDAVAAAAAGDVVHVLDGTYALNSTLNISQAITLQGQSETGVVFDVNCGAGYGIHPSVGGVVLQNLTLNVVTPSGEYAGYTIHASGTPNVQVGLTITNVTVQGAGGVLKRRAGVDIHGYDNVTLNNVTSKDATWGNGIQLTGCANVTVEGCTTANNAWGSLSIYCSNSLVPGRGSSNIAINGDNCTFGEGNVFIEDEFGFTSTGVVVAGYDFLMWNDEFRVGAAGFTFIKDTLADAVAFALAGFGGYESATSIMEIATGEFLVDASLGIGLTIQAAVDAAPAGGVVNVAAGTYQEQVIIDKSLSLLGAGATSTTVEAPDPIDRAPYQITTWTSSIKTVDPVIGAVAAGTVHIADLTVDGRDTGPDNFYGIHFFDTSGSITDCTVAGIHYPAGPGAQNVVSIVATQGVAPGELAIEISDNTVPSFQKGGIAIKGPDQTFVVNGNNIASNLNPDIAGNGIQLSYGATGSTAGNTVTGVGYTGDDWAGTGILLFECGDVTMNADTVTGSQSGVNYSDWRWVYAHPVPVNLVLNDLVLTDNEWSLGAQLSGEESDLNLTINGGTIDNSGGDAIDVFGTGPNGSYYSGWNNGNANVSITGTAVDGVVLDGLWVADLSGNTTNAFDSFVLREVGFENCTENAVNNDATEQIDARLCWWNDADGPTPAAKRGGGGTIARPTSMPTDLPENPVGKANERAVTADKAGDGVAGNVLYAGWLADAPANLGPRPWALSTSLAGGGIGAALDVAVDDETLAIAPGTYDENINLDKRIDLLGSGSGSDDLVDTIVLGGSPQTFALGASGLSSLDPLTIQDLRVEPTDYAFNFAGSLVEHILLENVIVQGNDPVDDTESNVGIKVSTLASVNDLQIVDCAFEHLAYGWYFAKQGDWGPGGSNVTDVAVSGTSFSYNQAKAIYVEKLSQATFEDCSFVGNGQDTGFWNSAWNAGVDVNLKGEENYTGYVFRTCNFSGNGLNSREGVGLTVKGRGTGDDSSYSDHPALVDDVLVEDCVFTGNERGVRFGEPGKNNTSPTNVVMTGCQVVGNVGVYAGGDGSAYGGLVNATSAIDDARGNWWGATDGPSGIGAGSGDAIANTSTGAVLFDPWLGDAAVAAVPATALINCDGSVTVTVQLTTDDFTPPVFLFNAVMRATSQLDWNTPVSADPFGSTTQFLVFDNGDGSYQISGSTTGSPTQPIDAAGVHDLFSVTFDAASEGLGDITFDSFVLRDPSNQTITSSRSGSQITIDCTAPAAVTGITAAPGHNKVEVSWTHDGSDVDHFEVYRAVWYDGATDGSAYPEYDDLPGSQIPARPLNYGALSGSVWERVDDGTLVAGVSSTTDTGMFDGRGVYYYEVFAIDAVANATAPAAANDRATNYWLGDFNADGLVNIFDVSMLGDSFGLTDPTEIDDNWDDDVYGSIDNTKDVGPTDDFSRLGVPTTDNTINFEDLMIVALNYGVVSASKSEADVSDTIHLAWVQYSETRWALRLLDGRGLQGVRVRADLPSGAIVTLEPGDLLDTQDSPHFLRAIGQDLDLNLALLGSGKAFTGEGDLFVVESTAPLAADQLSIDARNLENGAMTVDLAQLTDVELPQVFSLGANFPNPFNPATTIRFALPESQPVRLTIYGVDGRRVATLADGDFPAGRHEVTWYGRDVAGRPVASGTYVYRIEAGPYSAVRKMTLMK
ncbi:MAG: FlgD immunoglobulin-like domain containing protein [Candidatus Krumholzibacteriia bacterium]